MNTKDKFRIGVKYGVLSRMIKKISGRSKEERKQRALILKDMRFAGEELIDFLTIVKPKNIDEFKKRLNDWLKLEAKAVGGEYLEYFEGEGENLFKKVELERAIFYKKIK